MIVATKTDLSKAIDEFYVTGKEAGEKEGGSILTRPSRKAMWMGSAPAR